MTRRGGAKPGPNRSAPASRRNFVGIRRGSSSSTNRSISSTSGRAKPSGSSNGRKPTINAVEKAKRILHKVDKRREIYPVERLGSPFFDGRAYIPTVDDFNDTERGSMLDEVSLLPLEELTSLMCGATVFSTIRSSPMGDRLLELCRDLQEKHSCLDLRAIANENIVRKRTLRLLLHEGCNDEFLAPGAINAYLLRMLRCVVSDQYWTLKKKKEFCWKLAESLLAAKPNIPLMDCSENKRGLYGLMNPFNLDPADLQEGLEMSAQNSRDIVESLLANMLRFFVLYAVHGFRDQVLVTLSQDGEVLYRLKNVDEVSTNPSPDEAQLSAPSWQPRWVSDEVMRECIPLPDDYIPSLNHLKKSGNSSSLPYQVAHLPVPQIVRLILGDALFLSTMSSSPAFFSQMHQYAALLKYWQSCAHFENKFGQEFQGDLYRKRFVKKLLAPLDDWAIQRKKADVLFILVKRLGALSPGNPKQPLWNEHDIECGSHEWYYILKRFKRDKRGGSYSIEASLVKQLARRLNQFFFAYAIHCMRISVTVSEQQGSILFLPATPDPRNKFRVDVPIKSPVDETPRNNRRSAISDKLPDENNKQEEAPPALNLQAPQEKQPPSLPDTGSKKSTKDSAWETNFFERVKNDDAVPIYFKTTFGILVANNKDLREEREFLQLQLNFS
ncbi:hypothetical protein Q1695_009888 [Nippostrongylus brasiliensis]|nr:hypothetical protein Q1695_009888 [Nippostrongylus brasiliensis]